MKHHVLVLDDEADVRTAIRLQLKGTRFEILEAENVEQAIGLLGDNPISIDVIICDVRMPGMSGVEAVAFFQRRVPDHAGDRPDRLSGRRARRGLHEAEGRGRLSDQAGGKGQADRGGRAGRARPQAVRVTSDGTLQAKVIRNLTPTSSCRSLAPGLNPGSRRSLATRLGLLPIPWSRYCHAFYTVMCRLRPTLL